MSWGKKLEAWEVKTGWSDFEPIHGMDVILGIAIGVAATLLCIGLLN